MSKIKIQPKIRFKEFDNSWKKTKFKLFISKAGKKNSANNDFPAYSVSNKVGLIPQNEQFEGGRLDFLEKTSYKIVNPKEFAYNPARINVGSIGFNDLGFPVLVSSLYVVVKMSEALNNDYVLQYIKSPEFIKEVKKNTEGSVREYLFFESLKNVKLPYTELIAEQIQIASFFKKLDEMIDLQQQCLDDYKQLKKAMLQKMFPKNNEKIPQIRFNEYTNTWKLRMLNELAEFNPKSNLPDKFEYVDLESVIGTELIRHRTEKKDSSPSRAQRLAQKNDVFYQTVRPYQKNNYLFDLPYDNYVFSTGYAQMRPKNSGYFLLTLIQEDKFVNRVLERSTGTSYPAINSNDLAKLPVKVPADIEEQQKIGSFFKQLDDTIALHQSKLDSYKEFKKAMLQRMFI